MFDKFDNTTDSYVPDNTSIVVPTFDISISSENLATHYNTWGIADGYEWDYGEDVNITVTVNFTITVNSDSIVYSVHNQAPTTATVGATGQKCYNTVDLKSWSFVSQSGTTYTWAEDECLTYPSTGTLSITMAPIMTGRTLEVNIYNFKYENVYSEEFSALNTATVEIDSETSAEVFLKGQYYLEVVNKTDDEYNLVAKTNIYVK